MMVRLLSSCKACERGEVKVEGRARARARDRDRDRDRDSRAAHR